MESWALTTSLGGIFSTSLNVNVRFRPLKVIHCRDPPLPPQVENYVNEFYKGIDTPKKCKSFVNGLFEEDDDLGGWPEDKIDVGECADKKSST